VGEWSDRIRDALVAEGYFGFLAMFVSLDNPGSSALTREVLGWQPVHPGLLDDLGQGHCFRPE